MNQTKAYTKMILDRLNKKADQTFNKKDNYSNQKT
jgi:hypothetical protein